MPSGLRVLSNHPHSRRGGWGGEGKLFTMNTLFLSPPLSSSYRTPTAIYVGSQHLITPGGQEHLLRWSADPIRMKLSDPHHLHQRRAGPHPLAFPLHHHVNHEEYTTFTSFKI